MLDLQTGVHLDEIELAILPEKLDCASAAVPHIGHGICANGAHPVALGGGQYRRGRFFQNFLMATLQRTIAFAKMHGLTFAVAEYLKLDMARVAEIFFEIDGSIAERRLGLRSRLLHLGFKLVFGIHDLHTAATAARCRLDNHRIADIAGDCFGLADIVDCAIRAGDQRQSQFAGRAFGLDLVAHRPDMFGLGADPFDVVAFDDFCELRVFR